MEGVEETHLDPKGATSLMALYGTPRFVVAPLLLELAAVVATAEDLFRHPCEKIRFSLLTLIL